MGVIWEVIMKKKKSLYLSPEVSEWLENLSKSGGWNQSGLTESIIRNSRLFEEEDIQMISKIFKDTDKKIAKNKSKKNNKKGGKDE